MPLSLVPLAPSDTVPWVESTPIPNALFTYSERVLLALQMPLFVAFVFSALLLFPVFAFGQADPTPSKGDKTKGSETKAEPPAQPGAILPYDLGFQATLIDQNLFRFRSRYQGLNSLRSRDENEKSDTYTLYLGVRAIKELEFFINPEMARGNGISTAVGLAGFTNGDVIRNPTLGQEPYLGRYFLRGTIATGKGEEKIEPGENQIVGTRPKHRLVFSFGKLGANDIFDTNAYSNSTRTQFMNWALINNGAYDYAADTRGYTRGASLEWVYPNWALRLGSFQMPTEANGIHLSMDFTHSRGDQAELELHQKALRHRLPLVVRLLGYRNLARMGNYRNALAVALHNGKSPDIISVRERGSVKCGFGINFEQPLGDDDKTGVFGRYGWNDGATESFAYTEIDRTLCLGAQLSGARWHRPDDRLAISIVQNDLSGSHKSYLAAGGVGFLLGDGKLTYGSEQILETYYSWQVAKPLSVALDYQLINNPGYNQDRGPVSVLSLRVHLEY